MKPLRRLSLAAVASAMVLLAAEPLSQSDRTFAINAAEGGIAEVEMGKLAVVQGSSQAVRDFGRRMVDDHSKASDQLMTCPFPIPKTAPALKRYSHHRLNCMNRHGLTELNPFGNFSLASSSLMFTVMITSSPSVQFTGVATGPFGPGPIAGFTATADIDREDWGLSWNVPLEGGGVLVGKKVRLEIEGEAKLRAADAPKA